MRRAQLHTLTAQLQQELRLNRWTLLPSRTAIQPIVIGANDETVHAAAMLHQQHLWVPAIRPPTVAPGTARLRITLSASHSRSDVMQLTRALNLLEAGA
jgi:8-amino-7-oxononanoate synthase